MRNALPAFAESTLVSAVEHIDSSRELVAMAAAGQIAVLADVINELARAQAKIRNVLALIEAERREAARDLDRMGTP